MIRLQGQGVNPDRWYSPRPTFLMNVAELVKIQYRQYSLE